MRNKVMLLFPAVAVFAVNVSNLLAAAGSNTEYFRDRLIIKFASPLASQQKTISPSTIAMPGNCNAILTAAGAEEVMQLFPEQTSPFHKNASPYDLASIYEIHFGREVEMHKIIQRLRTQPGVLYVEPVYLRETTYDPNDPALARGFQNYLTQIRAREAWDISRGDTAVVIAIVDTGVDWTHEDLAANIWRNPGEIAGNNIDDDNNGYIDDIRGWDFGGLTGTPDNDPREDAPDHGTHVAGIAAAVGDNGKGVAGVAYRCKIMPVKVTQNNVRTSGNRPLLVHGYRGIVYAANNGADIINLSWGGGGFSQYEQEIINYAATQGAVVVAAAGNDNESIPFYPAAYQNAFSVAATLNDVKTSFSSFGYWVDIAAPGQSIFSTWQNDTLTYRYADGTSMASPVVAGVCALVKSIHPDWSPQQIAQHVRVTADNINGLNPGYIKQLGSGRVNAQRALLPSTSPAVRMINMIADEINGDHDSIFEPGEDIGLTFTFTNYLQPANNLQITASTSNSSITVTQPSLNIGFLGAGQTVTAAQQIIFHINDSAPQNQNVEFLLDMLASGYSDWQPFHILIRPTSVTVEGGNVALTMSSFGAAGYRDYAGTGGGIGAGFQFPISSLSALYHGGFIVATAANKVSDVSYGRADGSIGANPRYDFLTTVDGEIRRAAPEISTNEFVSRFDDRNAESPIGVEVTQTMLSWAEPPHDDFVILQYVIRNKSGAPLNNLYAGFYLDWDIGESSVNFAGWDAGNQLGYMYGPASNYYGICAVSPASATSYRAVNNPNEVWNNKYTDAEKYQFFTGGFAVVNGTSISDWSQQLGYGPFTLQSNETVTVAFALLGGVNLDDLKTNAQAARAVYTVTGVDEAAPAPLRFELAQNLPNPFYAGKTSQTVIAYSLAGESAVQVKVFNVLGQEIATLREARQSAGRYTLAWDGRTREGLLVPSGIYFYQVLANNVRLMRRMIVVR